MTRHDFDAVADVIRDMPDVDWSEREFFAKRFAAGLKKIYPLLDVDRFMTAACPTFEQIEGEPDFDDPMADVVEQHGGAAPDSKPQDR